MYFKIPCKIVSDKRVSDAEMWEYRFEINESTRKTIGKKQRRQKNYVYLNGYVSVEVLKNADMAFSEPTKTRMNNWINEVWWPNNLDDRANERKCCARFMRSRTPSLHTTHMIVSNSNSLFICNHQNPFRLYLFSVFCCWFAFHAARNKSSPAINFHLIYNTRQKAEGYPLFGDFSFRNEIKTY